MEIPDENTVMVANEMALKPRSSSKRRRSIPVPNARGAVIEGHHENADEHHGGYCANPVKMAGGDAILRALTQPFRLLPARPDWQK